MKVLIVESPAKAKKIQSFYKNDIKVISSCGHINNLDPKKLDMMINDNFNPIYINSDSKNKIISQLKKYKKEEIILAADDDREGDAIAWHVGNLYKLNYNNNNRIIFNEISKKNRCDLHHMCCFAVGLSFRCKNLSRNRSCPTFSTD